MLSSQEFDHKDPYWPPP